MNQNLAKEKVGLSGQIRAKQALHNLTNKELKNLVKVSMHTISKIRRGCNSVKFENYYEVLNALNKYGEE